MFSFLKWLFSSGQKPVSPDVESAKNPEAEAPNDEGFVRFSSMVSLGVKHGKLLSWLQTFVRGVVLDLRAIGEKDAFFLVEENEASSLGERSVVSGELYFRGIAIPLFCSYLNDSLVSGVGKSRGSYAEDTVYGVQFTSYASYDPMERRVRKDIAKAIVAGLYHAPDRDNISFIDKSDKNPLLGDILSFAKECGWNIPLIPVLDAARALPNPQTQGCPAGGYVRDDFAPVLEDISKDAQRLDSEARENVLNSVGTIRDALTRFRGEDSSSARRKFSVLFNLASVCRDLLRAHIDVAGQNVLKEGDTESLCAIFQGVARLAKEDRKDVRASLEIGQGVARRLLAEHGIRI